MRFVGAMQFSKGQINRSGEMLSGARPATGVELAGARDCAQYFRSLHSYPLTKVALGVRQMTPTATGHDAPVAQRLKRFPQMVHKLRRVEGMDLARMGDIGGCRVILPNGEDVAKLTRHLRRRWSVPDNRHRNYIDAPQATGYRGVHLYTERDDRQIEVQLRTEGQHDWAQNVERIALITGWPLKDGEGPPSVLEYFRVAGAIIAAQEAGLPADDEWARLHELRQDVLDLIDEKARRRP